MTSMPELSELPRASVKLARPHVRGKFIYLNDEKFYIRGVTYGTFRPDSEDNQYHTPEIVDRDFTHMRSNGINAIRTYTVPPRWLLDLAQHHGMYVMVGLPWEQHVAFLDGDLSRSIEDRVRASVRSCAGHPAVLCFTIGNEIPASVVRWYGRRRVERFLRNLYRAVKAEDAEALVTYVNYPTTEYLRLPFVDFVAFNVYLETQDKLDSYLARLQNIAGHRPLVMAEIGLDSRGNGEDAQALALGWQVRAAFAAGCAGSFVFAWTDEWYRGGQEVEDWDFGLTDRARRPKPALAAVSQAFAEVPFPHARQWPRISVVVCSYNGARTIRETCEHLLKLEYPNFDIVVVDDGSTDATAEIVREYLQAGKLNLISTPNRGLSNARNTGMRAATGEIVAYIDDDAYPDPHWLDYLAHTFMSTEYVGVGGPNIAPPEDDWLAACVDNAPGNPIHILLSDTEAEHIPGCNMAFRKSNLQAIGGFDPQYRVAGDDVDVCWRLQQEDWKLGFSPAAMVWHHRRNSLRAYWNQQLGYGKAEAHLERKWPEKYNAAGQLGWSGRLYGKGFPQALIWRRGRIYQGTWGSAPFQTAYQPEPGWLGSLPLMPEWFLIVGMLAVLTALGVLWAPLLVALPLLILAVAVTVAQACLGGSRASFSRTPRSGGTRTMLRIVTALLHFLHPLARLRSRLRHGLTVWRQPSGMGLALPYPRTSVIWSLRWYAPETWLGRLERSLRESGASIRRGGDFDSWDLEVGGGLFGSTQTQIMIEEHGNNKQLVRFRIQPRFHAATVSLTVLFALLAGMAVLGHAQAAALILGGISVLLLLRILYACASTSGAILRTLHQSTAPASAGVRVLRNVGER